MTTWDFLPRTCLREPWHQFRTDQLGACRFRKRISTAVPFPPQSDPALFSLNKSSTSGCAHILQRRDLDYNVLITPSTQHTFYPFTITSKCVRTSMKRVIHVLAAINKSFPYQPLSLFFFLLHEENGDSFCKSSIQKISQSSLPLHSKRAR